jgi:hypothetical protein
LIEAGVVAGNKIETLPACRAFRPGTEGEHGVSRFIIHHSSFIIPLTLSVKLPMISPALAGAGGFSFHCGHPSIWFPDVG